MKAQGRHYRTIWLNADGRSVDLIDQRWLPHDFRIETVTSVATMATAIRDMWVRGAPLIGVAADIAVDLDILVSDLGGTTVGQRHAITDLGRL